MVGKGVAEEDDKAAKEMALSRLTHALPSEEPLVALLSLSSSALPQQNNKSTHKMVLLLAKEQGALRRGKPGRMVSR